MSKAPKNGSMNYFDFNVHLPKVNTFDRMIKEDVRLSGKSLLNNLSESLEKQPSNCIGCNVMLFNQSLTSAEINDLTSQKKNIKEQELFFTLLASPYIIGTEAKLNKLKDSGINAIKFHSYQQKIRKEEYSKYIELAIYAESAKLPILIDTSFGSLNMYDFDNLDFAAKLVQRISKVPVVLLHSGGSRAMEALHIAESASNIFLDMSFSVHYYLSSTIENDIAFCYKKIGANRIVYGSDYPYINNNESLESCRQFFERNKFTEDEIKRILADNYKSIM